jgi:hypothetical protein
MAFPNGHSDSKHSLLKSSGKPDRSSRLSPADSAIDPDHIARLINFSRQTLICVMKILGLKQRLCGVSRISCQDTGQAGTADLDYPVNPNKKAPFYSERDFFFDRYNGCLDRR